MNQEASGGAEILERLSTLGVGQKIIYGYVNRHGSSIVDPAVVNLVRTLEAEHKIMRFQRKGRGGNDTQLVAVGTTRALNERIDDGICSYVQKMGFKRDLFRSSK